MSLIRLHQQLYRWIIQSVEHLLKWEDDKQKFLDTSTVTTSANYR